MENEVKDPDQLDIPYVEPTEDESVIDVDEDEYEDDDDEDDENEDEDEDEDTDDKDGVNDEVVE